MVEIFDLVYDTTGLEIEYWAALLGLMMIAAILYYVYKYKKIYHNNSELFAKSKNYLEKVEEYRRKPLPIFILLILIFMVIIEAAGFAYIFSQYILNDASNSDLRVAGICGAILLACVLVPLTHISGENIYYNKKIDTLDSYMMNRDDIKISKIEHLNINNTYNDNDKKDRAYSIFSRIEPEIRKGKFIRKKIVLIVTLITIGITAFGAYKVREQTYLTTVKTEMSQFEVRKSEFNENTEGLPSFMLDTAKDNANTQHRGIIEAKRKSNLMTYIVLMVMFIAIQVIGIFTGMNWGFVGKESKLAYMNMRNFKEDKKQ